MLSGLLDTQQVSMQLIHAVKTNGGAMTGPDDEKAFLHDLKAEVEIELTMSESSHPVESNDGPAEWLVDPADTERDEVTLRSLLGAIQALEGDDESPGSA